MGIIWWINDGNSATACQKLYKENWLKLVQVKRFCIYYTFVYWSKNYMCLLLLLKKGQLFNYPKGVLVFPLIVYWFSIQYTLTAWVLILLCVCYNIDKQREIIKMRSYKWMNKNESESSVSPIRIFITVKGTK